MHLHEYSDESSLIIDKNQSDNKTTSFSAMNGGGPIKFEVLLVGQIIIFVIRVRRFLALFFISLTFFYSIWSIITLYNGLCFLMM